MQSLNVLIAGEGKYVEEIKPSKFLNKLYVTSENEIEGTVQIKFNTFKELAQKCKTLQIDLVLVENKKWVLEGIAQVMKQHFVNCFATSTDWTELELSHHFARKMLEKYDINLPPIITLQVEFPVLVKGDGILKIANSMPEIIDIKEKIYNISSEVSKNVFLEKYIKGEKYKIISLYDGKHLLTFPHEKFDYDMLKDYSQKLETMLLREKANFIGFINSDLIEEDGILYNLGFSFEFIMPNFEVCQMTHPKDILYFCISAVYQKLNELRFTN